MGPDFILGRYRYISRLGSGGLSTVMLAEDTLLHRQVALKRVYASDDVAARSRLRREAVIGASLSHPNLVSIFDIVTTEDGEDVIVMEYVEGETLRATLRRGEKPDPSTALEMLAGVSAALDAIHARGIVHRDVKPSNVLVGVDGSVKLADLGIAAVTDRTQITTVGAVIGTFSYMAPEQLEGATATPAVDVYGLAAVAFESLSGKKARHESNPLALAHAIATQPPPDLRSAWPDAPPAAAEILMRAMSRDPKARPRSAGELIAGLRKALEPRPTKAAAAVALKGPERARRPAPAAVASSSKRSRGALVAAMAATVLGAAAVAGIVLANSGTKPRQQVAAANAVRSASARAHSRPMSRATTHRRASRTTTRARASRSTVTSAVPASKPPVTAPPTSAPPTSPTPPASPVDAVEAFYHLAASHQYAAAWALADPDFRAQLLGYQGLQATMARERAIIFNGVSLLNQSPGSATVSVRTTSLQDTGSQSCYGTVNLLRAGSSSPSWLLDHIAISCV